METSPLQLLEELIEAHPDSYIKIGSDVYMPTHTKLWDFKNIRDKLRFYQDKTFTIESHNDLPVIISCDSHEVGVIKKISKKLIYGKCDLRKDEQLTYIILLNMIAAPGELKDMIKDIEFTNDFWYKLSTLGLDASHIFDKKTRLDTIKKLYKGIVETTVFDIDTQIGKSIWTYPTICKFGRRCHSITGGYTKGGHRKKRYCDKSHPKREVVYLPEEKYLTDYITKVVPFYGFTYMCADYEFNNILSKSMIKDPIKYDVRPVNYKWSLFRPSTKMLYETINFQIRRGEHTIYILDTCSEYDLDTELKSFITEKNKNYKKSIHCGEIELYIDGGVETFYIINAWKPYRCGYKCDTQVYHGHGN